MAEKTKSKVIQVASAVQDAVATVVTAANQHIVQPVGSALGITGDATKGANETTGSQAEVVVPAKPKSAAARMMTKSIAIKQSRTGKSKTQRVTDVAKPSQKPSGGAARKARRKGASKGR
ncbi:MAG TPA: hypothetical protein VGJ26_20635 [Pirellulales bacterium]|jgi:hypothetical protein